MRVRTGRFEKLRSCESREAESIKVSDREDAIRPSFAVPPPVRRASRNERRQLVRGTETAEATVDRRPRAPVLELDGAKSVMYSRIQISEDLRGLRQTEVGLPAWQVCPHLFGNLDHVMAADTSGAPTHVW